MILKRTNHIKSNTYSITKEESRKITEQKINNSMPTLESRLARAKRKSKINEIKQRNKREKRGIIAPKISPKY